jgi:squalene monooxygenase
MPGVDVDVVIAGGGVAGLATAAALGEFGWSTLVVEPGQRAERRLAGELIHPPGVAGLTELGLCGADGFADAVPIKGFCVFHDGDQPGIQLPYGNGRAGDRAALALEHGAIRAGLAAAAARLSHVTMWRGARVVGLDLSRHAAPRVSIARQSKVETLRCRMVVGADGATSPVRALGGIAAERRRLSNITGYVVESDALPAPGFGHVFMSRTAPLLAYEIGGDRARVLFDRAIGSDEPPADHRRRAMATLPRPLRTALAEAVERQRGLDFVSADVHVEATGRGPLVFVGDAGGSCHPLTATGMSVGIGDALRLREALRDRNADIGGAIALYARRRRAPQRARLLLASALHEACSRQDPSARLIRDGLIGYWERDARGREASMALLTMADTRVVAILREMASIVLLGMTRRSHRQRPLLDWLRESARLTVALSALLLRHAPMVLKAR